MDCKFPGQLFPSHFNSGPPSSVHRHNVGGWGSYEGVLPVNVASKQGGSKWKFVSKHEDKGETWLQTEPIPLPLLSPKTVWQHAITPSDELDFPKQMQNFYLDNHQDAFSSMSTVIGEHFSFAMRGKRSKGGAVDMGQIVGFIERLKYKRCEYSTMTNKARAYNKLLHDVIHDIPPALLGDLLHDELAEQRGRLQLSECSTGGALAYVPFTQNSGSSQQGCLLYPGSSGLCRLNFHKVVLECKGGSPPCLDARSNQPVGFRLSAPVRQISSASLLDECCVGVRSDYLCGVWRVSERVRPRRMEVIQTKEPATCISVSPHILGETLVACESGAAYLWTVGKSVQKFREAEENLYFNAKSPWRWCEFSAHPRVTVFADRTGVELTDIRTKEGSSHTLFRIGSTPECKTGERVIFTKYMGQANPFHQLITTQYSAYILDERFPCMAMLKWDHMMQSPPMFGHIIPASATSWSTAGRANPTKILLGSQSSQEISMLQYSGGGAEACRSCAPIQALLKPTDTLHHLPALLPHHLDTVQTRLDLPAAGLACIQHSGGGDEGCLCVLQLTESGDIFYQMLRSQKPDVNTSRPSRAREDITPQKQQPAPSWRPTTRKRSSSLSADDVYGDSEEDIIGPTQNFHGSIPETPEKGSGSWGATETVRRRRFSDASIESTEDSELWRRRHHLNVSGLEIVMNDEPDHDQVDLQESDMNDIPQKDVERRSAGRNDPPKLTDETRLKWRKWIHKLKANHKDKAETVHPHTAARISCLLNLPLNRERDSLEEDHLKRLRYDLRRCMTTGSLLVHSGTYLRTLEPVPIPNPVDPAAWSDELSQRMTMSWEGHGDAGWKSWWVEKLGLNREEKVEALRRKRRREKRASKRVELSGSFTSSFSSQSDMDDVSSAWSSATSRGRCSDVERDFPPQLDDWSEPETPRGAGPTGTPSATPVATPHKRQQNSQQEPLTPSPPKLVCQVDEVDAPVATSKTATRSRSNRQSDLYLSSLFDSQGESSQAHWSHMEDVTMADVAVHSPQKPASISAVKRTLQPDLSQRSLARGGHSLTLSQSSQARTGLSQSSQARTGLSQSSQARTGLSQSSQARTGLSQSSQARTGLSQSSQARTGLSQLSQVRTGLSQPKKKKSRMGF